MPINVSEALDLDTSEVVTVTRYVAGNYVDGIYVEGSSSTFKTLASVQQPTQEDLKNLPEGERTDDIRKFISKKVIQTASVSGGTLADTISYQSKTYKVTAVLDWSAYGHTTVLAVRNP